MGEVTYINNNGQVGVINFNKDLYQIPYILYDFDRDRVNIIVTDISFKKDVTDLYLYIVTTDGNEMNIKDTVLEIKLEGIQKIVVLEKTDGVKYYDVSNLLIPDVSDVFPGEEYSAQLGTSALDSFSYGITSDPSSYSMDFNPSSYSFDSNPAGTMVPQIKLKPEFVEPEPENNKDDSLWTFLINNIGILVIIAIIVMIGVLYTNEGERIIDLKARCVSITTMELLIRTLPLALKNEILLYYCKAHLLDKKRGNRLLLIVKIWRSVHSGMVTVLKMFTRRIRPYDIPDYKLVTRIIMILNLVLNDRCRYFNRDLSHCCFNQLALFCHRAVKDTVDMDPIRIHELSVLLRMFLKFWYFSQKHHSHVFHVSYDVRRTIIALRLFDRTKSFG